MKKSIIVLLISLLFITNLESAIPYGHMVKDSHCIGLSHNNEIELVDRYDVFYRINIKSSTNFKETLKLLQNELLKNELSYEIIDDNSIKDIKKNDFCNIYVTNINGYNNVILDMKFKIEDNIETINNKEGELKINKLSSDIKDTLKDNIIKLDINRNLKLKLNNKFSIKESKAIVEKYLEKNDYKSTSVDIYNGYSIKVQKNKHHDLGFQLSIIEYCDDNYILVGEPYIYISY